MQKRLSRSTARYAVWDVDSGGPKEPDDRCPKEGAIFQGQEADLGHARTCPVVDILKTAQKRAAPVLCRCRLGVLDGVHTGATWRIRLNRPCAAAMRLYVKLR